MESIPTVPKTETSQDEVGDEVDDDELDNDKVDNEVTKVKNNKVDDAVNFDAPDPDPRPMKKSKPHQDDLAMQRPRRCRCHRSYIDHILSQCIDESRM